jgi:hypothetical protein
MSVEIRPLKLLDHVFHSLDEMIKEDLRSTAVIVIFSRYNIWLLMLVKMIWYLLILSKQSVMSVFEF